MTVLTNLILATPVQGLLHKLQGIPRQYQHHSQPQASFLQHPSGSWDYQENLFVFFDQATGQMATQNTKDPVKRDKSDLLGITEPHNVHMHSSSKPNITPHKTRLTSYLGPLFLLEWRLCRSCCPHPHISPLLICWNRQIMVGNGISILQWYNKASFSR